MTADYYSSEAIAERKRASGAVLACDVADRPAPVFAVGDIVHAVIDDTPQTDRLPITEIQSDNR